MGRPSTYDADTARVICERLSKGETLRAICRDEHMPPPSTVRLWALDDQGPGFAAQYAQARDLGLDAMADELLDISDDASGDEADTPDGSRRMDSEFAARSKLRVDTRKWFLSKLAPKRYGDRLDVAVSGDVSFGERLAAARKVEGQT